MKVLEIIYKILRCLSFLFLNLTRKVRSGCKEDKGTKHEISEDISSDRKEEDD